MTELPTILQFSLKQFVVYRSGTGALSDFIEIMLVLISSSGIEIVVDHERPLYTLDIKENPNTDSYRNTRLICPILEEVAENGTTQSTTEQQQFNEGEGYGDRYLSEVNQEQHNLQNSAETKARGQHEDQHPELHNQINTGEILEQHHLIYHQNNSNNIVDNDEILEGIPLEDFIQQEGQENQGLEQMQEQAREDTEYSEENEEEAFNREALEWILGNNGNWLNEASEYSGMETDNIRQAFVGQLHLSLLESIEFQQQQKELPLPPFDNVVLEPLIEEWGNFCESSRNSWRRAKFNIDEETEEVFTYAGFIEDRAIPESIRGENSHTSLDGSNQTRDS